MTRYLTETPGNLVMRMFFNFSGQGKGIDLILGNRSYPLPMVLLYPPIESLALSL